MLAIVIAVMLAAAAAAGFYSLSWGDISAAAISSCNDAVQLGVFLAGAMALWGGLMRVAEKSGMTRAAAKALRPVVRLLFGKLDDNAENAVSLNLTANLLGIGNAVTPTGIAAVKSLEKSRRPRRCTALLTVLNTASIQLVPVTVAAMRSANGSSEPFEILPAVLFTSFAAAAVGCIITMVLYTGGD